jgi:hypothetical protein
LALLPAAAVVVVVVVKGARNSGANDHDYVYLTIALLACHY